MLFERLLLTERFVNDLLNPDLTRDDARDILRALRMLDGQIRMSSLHLHRLEGDREGAWVAVVSPGGVGRLNPPHRGVRLTFDELPDGRRRMNTCAKTPVTSGVPPGAAP